MPSQTTATTTMMPISTGSSRLALPPPPPKSAPKNLNPRDPEERPQSVQDLLQIDLRLVLSVHRHLRINGSPRLTARTMLEKSPYTPDIVKTYLILS